VSYSGSPISRPSSIVRTKYSRHCAITKPNRPSLPLLQVIECAPFASLCGCMNRTVTHVDQVEALPACSTLAALLPQKHLGTVLRPNGGQICGFRVAVPNPGASQSGRLISSKRQTMANGPVSNQVWWFQAQPRCWLTGRCQP
jgi:hypothetical protein